jgi:hypothetical protein
LCREPSGRGAESAHDESALGVQCVVEVKNDGFETFHRFRMIEIGLVEAIQIDVPLVGTHRRELKRKTYSRRKRPATRVCAGRDP